MEQARRWNTPQWWIVGFVSIATFGCTEPAAERPLEEPPAATSALAIPTIRSEFRLATSTAGLPILAGQTAAASDGTNHFVVWPETREQYFGSLYGARVSDTGQVLDQNRIFIGDGLSFAKPAIAFGDSVYLVVWSTTTGLRAARVDPSGEVLDSKELAVGSAFGGATAPAVTYDGENFIVVWEDSRDGGTIYAARIDPDAATVLDPEGIQVSSMPLHTERVPTAASNGAGTLVVWAYSDDGFASGIEGIFLDQEGAGVAAISVVSSEDSQIKLNTPVVAYGENQYLVAWAVDENFSRNEVRAGRVAADGDVLDPGGFLVGAESTITSPGVTFDGTNYVVAWGGTGLDEGGRSARVSSQGMLLDPEGVDLGLAIHLHAPTLTADASGVLVTGHRATSFELEGVRVGADGEPVTPAFPVSLASNEAVEPAAAFNGTHYLVVWADSRNRPTSGWDIYGTRVDTAGNVLDEAFPISTAAASQRNPTVASDGGDFLVAWQDQRATGIVEDLYGTRVRYDGVVLDPEGVEISSGLGGQLEPRASFGADTYLVVWANRNDVFAARVSRDGIVSDPDAIPVFVTPFSEASVSVAFDGRAFLVATSSVLESGTESFLRTARVTPSGDVERVSELSRSGSFGYGFIEAACDKIHCMLLWLDNEQRVPGATDLYAGRLSRAGELLDPEGILIAARPDDERSARIAFDGTSYWVAWAPFEQPEPVADVSWTRVLTDGTVDPPGGSALGVPRSAALGDLVTAGPGQALVLYQRFDTRADAKNVRAFGRVLSDGAGEACNDDADCPATRHCADGVCCNQACEGQCEACDVPGLRGSCVPTSGAPRGARPRCGGVGECAPFCDGSHRDACVFPSADVICDPSCVDGVESASVCNGAGVCGEPTERACGAYACNPLACKTTCEGDHDCAAGHRCRAEGCIPIPSPPGGGGTGDGGTISMGGSSGEAGDGVNPNGGAPDETSVAGGGAGNASDEEPPSSESESCSCSVPGGDRPFAARGLAAFLAVLLPLARRKRRRFSTSS